MDLPIGVPSRSAPDVVEDDPGLLIYDEEIPTKSDSVFYVVDTSGSMGWDIRSYTGLDGSTMSGDRLDRAKVELIKSIRALPREFKFNVFAYGCGVYWWSFEKQQAEPPSKVSAIAWVNRLYADDATGTGPAVFWALGDKENKTIVLLSDGEPNCPRGPPWWHLQMIQAANTQEAVIHTFGISCYGEFERFMRAVAATSGGRYTPVP
jgi:hypothetical protein